MGIRLYSLMTIHYRLLSHSFTIPIYGLIRSLRALTIFLFLLQLFFDALVLVIPFCFVLHSTSFILQWNGSI